MNYDGLREVMSYFHFEMVRIYFMLGIVVLNSVKSIFYYHNSKASSKKDTIVLKNSRFDVIVSLFILIGFGCDLMFQGVLSDIPGDYAMYFNKVLIVAILAFILFMVQVVIHIIWRNSNKNKVTQKNL